MPSTGQVASDFRWVLLTNRALGGPLAHGSASRAFDAAAESPNRADLKIVFLAKVFS
jgi:hypothetical protein